MQTIAKQIPAGWKMMNFNEFIELSYGSNLPKNKREDGSTPVYGSNGITDYHSEPLVKGPGLIVGRKGSIGLVHWSDKNFWPIDTTYYVKESENKNLKWIYYKLQSLGLEKMNTASGIPGLNRNEVYSLKIAIPPLPEQTKIAAILSKVDSEIEKVEQIIKQTEKLKKGLMQKLLTKGIGHTKFKQSELGEIPEEWEVVTLKESDIEIIDGDRGENYPKKNEFMDEGHCLFLSNKNIKNDKFIFDECAFITEEKDNLLRKGKLKRFDVVLTTRGTVGNIAFFDGTVPFENIRLNSGMLIFRAGNDFASEFLYALFKSPLMKTKYTSVASGSAQPQLPIRSLEQIKIPLPPKNEQKKISQILESADQLLYKTKKQKKTLMKLKKGLMSDLLSGKVRIHN